MPVHHVTVHEKEYYPYYTGHITAKLLRKPDSMKEFETLVINCIYENGQLNDGRYLAPIYKTITHIKEVEGFYLICFK